ncbi:SNF2 domain-containing protein CLASSY 4-like [Capsicum chacoense]
MDSGDGNVPRRRTRQQALKYMVDLIEKRKRLNRSGNRRNNGENVRSGSKGKMVECSGGKNNARRKRPFVVETSDDDEWEEESDHDDVIIEEEEEEAADNSDAESNVGLTSPTLNETDEVVSSSSSMSRTVEILEELTDTTSSSDSESEASTDEDNDDSNDKTYREIESSTSDDEESEHDDLSCPENNEDGKKKSNKGLAVEGEKQNKRRAYHLRPRSLSKSKKKKLNQGSCTRPILLVDEYESSSDEKDCEVDGSVKNVAVQKDVVRKNRKGILEESESSSDEEGCELDDSVKDVAAQKDAVRKNRKGILEESEFLKFVVDSIKNVDDHNKLTPPEEKEQVHVEETLPLVFRFEDEEPGPPEKEEWEKEFEGLVDEMDMCLLESDIGFTNPSVSPMQSGQISDCQMGNHDLVLDEQIGLSCTVCSYVHLEMKYIFPDFAQRTRGRYQRKHFGESPVTDVDGFRFVETSAVQDFPTSGEGTVWDLVPPSAKETMYPHQRGGFEFMWKNIAGDISLERLREPLTDSKGGCIISHPPGTGKTRLTIVFLQSYLKLFPNCRPVIIAPSNLLLNWEAEFQKWEVDIPFHNLNSKDLSFQEDESTVGVFNCLSRAGRKNLQLIRMVKLRSWAKRKSVLGISYDLFRILTVEDGGHYTKETREILLRLPRLLVLEEGHTARNEQSLVWKALNKVETQKRILLSGTPFQNNVKELYNTLCVVSPKFAADLEQKWASISSCVDKNTRALEELRDIISPLVHTCSENVKKVSLPGIRDTVIHLRPTDLQKELLKVIPENPGSFYEQNLLSLISVHPSLVAKKEEFTKFESLLKEKRCRLDPDTGVKTKFVVELIRLCGGTKERVIIFSQLLDPLTLIKEQLSSLFGWTLGREILYMDGKLDVKQRQTSINSLNDPTSDVKVLLASTKACSEGISLIGASRVVLLDVLWNPSVEQQAISRAYRNGQTKFVHVYSPVTSKWEVDKIEQQTRKKYHSDVLLSRNEVNTSGSVSEDNILESMVKHESLRHIFEKLSHAPRTTCLNQPSS